MVEASCLLQRYVFLTKGMNYIYLQTLFSLGLIVHNRAYDPHFHSTFVGWRTCRFAFSGYCDLNFSEHGWARICVVGCPVLWAHARTAVAGSYGKLVLAFRGSFKLISRASGLLCNPPAVNESSLLQVFSSICCELFCPSWHSDRGKMKSQSHFHMHSLIVSDEKQFLWYFLANFIYMSKNSA